MGKYTAIKKRSKKSILERFFKHVTFLSSGCLIWKNPHKASDCAIWDGAKRIRIRPFVYRFFKRRPVPAGFILVATCGNPACVAPWHLKLERMGQLSSAASAQVHHAITHCPHGHPYDNVNTYHYKNALGHPARNCRTCMRERDRKRQEKGTISPLSGV